MSLLPDAPGAAWSVTVTDSMMVAHSLPGEVFGPAQALHGATYVVDATFHADTLDADGIVVDIGAAATALHECLADLTYSNLDDHPELAGTTTTTEVLAAFVARRLAARAAEGHLRGAGRHLLAIDVRLGESPSASATCTLRLR